MRILLVLALLLAGASCAWPPPPGPAAGPAPPLVVAPNPLAWLFGPPHGRLTLSNFSYDSARVETVVTPFPDCAPRPGTATSDFALPLNGTRIIAPPPGADVCWRRALGAATAVGAPPSTPGWSEWSRAFTSSGHAIDERL
ncbi:MAG TPA: hypothetical protein VND95_06700 [Stellaceae bacterium]|nr:hypothetical protein [Stellaceae bacterium]